MLYFLFTASQLCTAWCVCYNQKMIYCFMFTFTTSCSDEELDLDKCDKWRDDEDEGGRHKNMMLLVDVSPEHLQVLHTLVMIQLIKHTECHQRVSDDASFLFWTSRAGRCSGVQAEAEARPVRAPQHVVWDEDGRRGLDHADPEPAHGVRAGAAEGGTRAAGRPPREEAA